MKLDLKMDLNFYTAKMVSPTKLCGICLIIYCVSHFYATAWAADLLADQPEFRVQLDVPLRSLQSDWCWFHPRLAAIPGRGQNGQNAVIMTIQKHLSADDHYSGMYYLRTDDLGASWQGPMEIPELATFPESANVTISVADVTPGWHALSGKLLAIGTKVRYDAAGKHLLDQPESHAIAYSTFDPVNNRWTQWQFLQMPETEGRFFLTCPGCVQWLVRPDGTVLLPVYMRGPVGNDFQTTVLACTFDGNKLTYLQHGDLLAIDGGRGYVEPSLAKFRDQYYLTLRNDHRGYVASSRDGLRFSQPIPWRFDDGGELGSYNTQQHWLVHHEGLFLAYTRRGANNDHIPRHRAPIFIAQIDHENLHVIRQTEQTAIPERGVMLGNFGAAPVSEQESWITDSEYILSGQPDPRGGDGSTFVARIQWSSPNLLVKNPAELKIVTLGDSITKGVRSGVVAEETFAAQLQKQLDLPEAKAQVINVGIGGERTDGGLARLERDVLSAAPNLVLIMYGTNDSYVDAGAKQSRLTGQQYADNLRELVDCIRASGITPVLMTEPRYGEAASSNGLGEHPNGRLKDFMQLCREVAQQKNVPLIDHYQFWEQRHQQGFDVGQWTTDQCHPNAAGHAAMANLIAEVLRQHHLVP